MGQASPKFFLDRKAPQDIEDSFGGPVAQLAELPAHNRLVLGSSPSGSTTNQQKSYVPVVDFRAGSFFVPWGLQSAPLADQTKRRSNGLRLLGNCPALSGLREISG